MTNYLKTLVLLTALAALFGMIGIGLGDTAGMWLALALSLTANGYAYWHGPTLLIAAHGAVEIDPAVAPDLVNLVGALSYSVGIPTPRIFISESPQPNAFSVGRGRRHSAIVLTTSLLGILTKEELTGVLSHELAHIESDDTLTLTISLTIVGAVAAIIVPLFLIGRIIRGGKCIPIIFVAAVALLAAVILQLMLNRSREYAADKAGAIICGHPEWIVSALSKIVKATTQSDNNITVHYLTSVALYIVGPVSIPSWVYLFSTHPPIESRIEQLRLMANNCGLSAPTAMNTASAPLTAPDNSVVNFSRLALALTDTRSASPGS